VVVHTPDPERAIAHWRDRLGLRLALDRTFAERGLRLLFFRSGGLTLEYAYALDGTLGTSDDRVYGVSYRVGSAQAVRARLAADGIDVSELRAGMKPGSTVLTVRSGTAGVPTLLIQQPPLP
jgi:catechol 2,3-dioxygenase-like lactoylglutathione lyase family enzyme